MTKCTLSRALLSLTICSLMLVEGGIEGLIPDIGTLINFENSLSSEISGYSVVGPNALARSVLLDRQERLQQHCDEISDEEDDGSNIRQEMFDHLLVDERHKLLYCYVPKVACTNWKRVLMVSTGKWPGNDPLEIPANHAHSSGIFEKLNSYALPEIEQKLRTYNKLIVVRHPLERLLSAYRNKFEKQNGESAEYFQGRFGKRIVKKYRANATSESLAKGNDVTFREFVQFVTDGTSNETKNEHWRPITELCYPCTVNYNFVSKYESLAEDATEVLERMGAGWVRFPRGPQSNEPTSKRLSKYYSTLGFKELQRLASFYKMDLKLFDYTLEDVLGFSLA